MCGKRERKKNLVNYYTCYKSEIRKYFNESIYDII